ncbi:hypothetical protein KR074_005623, partial [Drosophila pseudoananassae]
MGSQLVWLLLVAVCTVSFLGESRAVCCTDNLTIQFRVKNNNCGALNARKVDRFCEIRICADGTRLVGYYCGKGPCNIFGCDCEGGCRHGDWVDSFVARNRHHGVTVVDSSESNGIDPVI